MRPVHDIAIEENHRAALYIEIDAWIARGHDGFLIDCLALVLPLGIDASHRQLPLAVRTGIDVQTAVLRRNVDKRNPGGGKSIRLRLDEIIVLMIAQPRALRRGEIELAMQPVSPAMPQPVHD